jgi:hypothetical protein
MLGRIKRGEQNCQTAHPREILRHRSHSFQIIIAHHLYRDPTKYPRHSSLPGMSDPSQRSSRQSIPIGHALGNGLVQPIFRPPSRRPLLVCFPSLSRRDAGLKMLCVMIVVGAIIVCSRVVIISGIDISGIVIPSIIGPVIPWSTAKRDTEALRFRIVLAYRQQS